MNWPELHPFAKVGGIVVALALFGLSLKFCGSKGDEESPFTDACKSLPMDSINPCIKRAREDCEHAPDRRACADDVASKWK